MPLDPNRQFYFTITSGFVGLEMCLDAALGDLDMLR